MPQLHKHLNVSGNVFSTMQKFLIVLILIVALTSCNQSRRKDGTKTLDFGAFTIETPPSWTKIEEKGVDSYVGRIAIDEKDTLDFDLGWYSNTLTEDEPQIVERSLLQNRTQPVDTTELIIVESRKGVDIDKYKKNNVSWDSIDKRRAKIVFPRRTGIGITGVYIDSLWISGAGVDRFNLYGENLSADNERKVLASLRTLKFRKK
jgi:hypothetical protein